MSFNFMATIPICTDFEAPKIKPDIVSTVSPSISHDVMGPDAMIFVSECCALSPVSLSSFTFIRKLYSSSLFSAISVVLSEYLRSLIFLMANWTLASASSSPVFLMMYSAFRSNKQGGNYNLDVLVFLFGTSLLFHVQF